MKLLLLAAFLVAFVGLSNVSTADAQQRPEFKLGFKALADRIPSTAGQPLENEHWGANGDSLQQTTKGLMVWRKADNWTAFTDRQWTWINGPQGVEKRLNTARFTWEEEQSAPAVQRTSVPAPAPTTLSGDGVLGDLTISGWAADSRSQALGALSACYGHLMTGRRESRISAHYARPHASTFVLLFCLQQRKA